MGLFLGFLLFLHAWDENILKTTGFCILLTECRTARAKKVVSKKAITSLVYLRVQLHILRQHPQSAVSLRSWHDIQGSSYCFYSSLILVTIWPAIHRTRIGFVSASAVSCIIAFMARYLGFIAMFFRESNACPQLSNAFPWFFRCVLSKRDINHTGSSPLPQLDSALPQVGRALPCASLALPCASLPCSSLPTAF